MWDIRNCERRSLTVRRPPNRPWRNDAVKHGDIGDCACAPAAWGRAGHRTRCRPGPLTRRRRIQFRRHATKGGVALTPPLKTRLNAVKIYFIFPARRRNSLQTIANHAVFNISCRSSFTTVQCSKRIGFRLANDRNVVERFTWAPF
jgi:hypothetical protein